jgi:S1-C subfamily serine protease
MNKIVLILLYLPIALLGQETNYHLLDSNFVEIKIANPNKISKKERKNIYYYSEYSFDKNSKLIGKNIFYAQGKYPAFLNNDFDKISQNKYNLISFKDAEKRTGKIRLKLEFAPIIVDADTLTNSFGESNLDTYTKSRFFPNGQVNYESNFSKNKYLEQKQVFYRDNGDIDKINRYDEKLNKVYSVKNYDDTSPDLYYFLINYPNYAKDDYSSYIVEKYEKDTERIIAKWYYKNNKEQIEKTEYFSNTGRKVFFPSDELGNKDEVFLKKYFKENKTPLIEGVYTIKSKKENLNYKVAVLEKIDGMFIGYQLSGFMRNVENWKPWEVRMIIEKTSVEGFYNLTWNNDYKIQEVSDIIEFKNGALTTFGSYNMIKLYPMLDSSSSNSKNKTGEWIGSGSGIIISKSGYIVTNHHVIEDADDIEVEFIIDGEVKKFNAEIIQVDKTNDLAVIKIFDINFDGLDDLPYNFKTRSSDVGTKVYAFGYPKALTGMGKEIKLTDGIISSKSGFDGDITTYQITAPIQGGNSGGPLFDDKGNFIGINSSGLRADVADNVGYTIKSSYVMNLIDVLPKSIDLPSNTSLQALPLTEQIKEISKYVVLVKVK